MQAEGENLKFKRGLFYKLNFRALLHTHAQSNAMSSLSSPHSMNAALHSMDAAFVDHQSWLHSLYARKRGAGGADTACATGSPPCAQQLSSPQSLPHAPMMWAQDEVLDATFSGMAIGGEIALDGDDFDGPIYRSLGSLTAFAEGGDALDGDDFDEPVYRSMSAAPLDASGDRQDMREGDEQLWLQTMPPLLCRQRGGQLA